MITDIDRNQSKSARTDGQGAYRIDFLLTGNYMVTVSVPGFKKYVQRGIVLNAGAPATVDVMLAPGDITESVEVTSAAPLVNTTNAEVGTTIDTRQIVELPLVNRNPYQLLDLTPGVQTNSSIQSFGAPSQVTLINGGADNGAGSTNYFLDGAKHDRSTQHREHPAQS
ncbi:MAG: putative collagen-binding protein [Edaphobacter sp.]|nr:putative collagen-binding protein [Edaphobacter sp.]